GHVAAGGGAAVRAGGVRRGRTPSVALHLAPGTVRPPDAGPVRRPRCPVRARGGSRTRACARVPSGRGLRADHPGHRLRPPGPALTRVAAMFAITASHPSPDDPLAALVLGDHPE